jgi:hypothetical protein
MLFPDPKKVATVIVSKMHPDGGHSNGVEVKPEEHMQPEMHGLHSSMTDFMEAMSNKSPDGMHKAMSSYLDQHHALVNQSLSKTTQDERFRKEHEGEYEYPEK